MTRLPTFLLLGLVMVVPAGRVAAQGFSPEEALKRMKVADGFEVNLVASEPLIRQPVTMTFDDRGRIWVIQYLQYPTPAGLKPVSVDQYLRTVYDKVPEPPPNGPKGADRITILEDPDESGRYRKAKDFVTGLNLATGLCLGEGGVFVLQSPYLLFYPDKDGDDVPDSDPVVLLKGFGMEDAHALANSLQWGPDGWLYGAQGSTVTAKITNPARPDAAPVEFQQGVWRYHPRTKQFELFSEGGGNTWGLDFDRHGNVIAGTNWGDKAMLHQVQGGYYVKGFSKHGPLHNPHSYGYFDHVPYTGFKGGHVTCGGVLYRGDTFPPQFQDQYIAANLLSNAIYWHTLERKGSTFTAKFGGDLLIANDTWFRPIDCLVGPDGALYVVDWYDKRANHVDPIDTWDRTNGRIYRIQAKGAPRTLSAMASRPGTADLVAMLDHKNAWWVREAQRMLAERRDPAAVPLLRKQVLDSEGQLALDSLFALYVSGGLDDEFAAKLFGHANEDVRTWTVRLLGDAKKVSPAVQSRLVELARTDKSSVVRSQLACTAKRLPAKDGLPIVRELLQHKEDVDDLHIPLLLWWAVEDKAISDRDLVLGLLDSPEAWRMPMTSQFIVERLARRYMAEGGEADYAACARLLQNAPGPKEVSLLVAGMEKALEGRRLEKVPPALEKALAALWEKQANNVSVVRFAVRLGSPTAYARALEMVADARLPDADRAALVEVISQAGQADAVPALLSLVGDGNKPAVRSAAVLGLQAFNDPKVADTLLSLYPKMPADLRGKARDLLVSRPASALAMLRAVDAKAIDPKEVPFDQLRRLRQLKNAEVDGLVEKHWGKIGAETSGERISRIRSIGNILVRFGPGDPVKGKALFKEHCATCHQLFGEGNKVGPDLTSADRKNRDFLITQVVDPSAIIRPEFVAYNVTTTDGRVLTGLVAEETPQAVTLLDAKNQKVVIGRDRIDDMKASPVSLMPDGLLDKFTEEMLCDLFAFLQSESPPK